MNENLKAFLQKASEDDALQAKLAEINASVMNDARAKFIKLAEESGYSFTEENFDQIPADSGKLSDDELNAVAGGAYTIKNKEGQRVSDCTCIGAGAGIADALQKSCTCTMGGSGELTVLGKVQAARNQIVTQEKDGTKVALSCALTGSSWVKK